MTTGFQGLRDPGRDAWCEDADVVILSDRLERERWEENEPRCCSICDGIGHGYPGGGACPSENRGDFDADEDARERWMQG